MHQQEALSGPAVVMSFFRAAVEKDIGSVRMSETHVTLKKLLLSKKPHLLPATSSPKAMSRFKNTVRYFV